MRGKDDGRLGNFLDLVDRTHAELFHLFNDTLVVHDLPEDGATAAAGSKALHLQIGDADPGAETVLGRAFDIHRR